MNACISTHLACQLAPQLFIFFTSNYPFLVWIHLLGICFPSSPTVSGSFKFITFLLSYYAFALKLKVLAPLPIGFAVFMVHLATIPVTGTGINPARSLGAAVIYNQEKAWHSHESIINYYLDLN